MKKWLKKILWGLVSMLAVITIGLVCIYFWLSTKWTSFYKDEEMKNMAFQITSAEPFSDNFYNAYDKIYPEQRNNTLAKMSFQAIWYLLTKNEDKLRNSRPCDCIRSTNYLENKVPISYHSFTAYITAHGLEKYATEGKCFDFNFRKIGVDSLAKKYFNKPIEELSLNENIELVIRAENPFYYEKRPESLKKN